MTRKPIADGASGGTRRRRRQLRILAAIGSVVFSVAGDVALAADEHQAPCGDAEHNGALLVRDSTRYDTERNYAMDLWDSMGTVYVGPGNATPDTIMKDYRDPTDERGGYADCGPRNMYLNRYRMDDEGGRWANAQQRKEYRLHVAAHEMGHALGLGDHDSPETAGILMHGSNRVSKLTKHDKADYRKRYGPSSGGCIAHAETPGDCTGAQPLVTDEPDHPDIGPSVPDLNPVLLAIDAHSNCYALYGKDCGLAMRDLLSSVIDGYPVLVETVCQQNYGKSCGATFGDFVRDEVNFLSSAELQDLCGDLYGSTCGTTVGNFLRDVIAGYPGLVQTVCVQLYARSCGNAFGGFVGDGVNFSIGLIQ